MGFPAHEQPGAVYARNGAHLNADRADGRGVTAVGAQTGLQDALARHLLDRGLEGVVYIDRCDVACGDALGKGGHYVGAHFVETIVQRHLAQAAFQQRLDARGGDPVDLGLDFIGRQEQAHGALFLAQFGAHLLDHLDHRLVDFVGQVQGVKHQVFGQLVGAGFHHQDVVCRARGHQAQAAVHHLGGRGVDDKLAFVHICPLKFSFDLGDY